MIPQFDAFFVQVSLNTSLIRGSEFFAGDKIFWKFLIVIQILFTQPMLKTFIILPLKFLLLSSTKMAIILLGDKVYGPN